MDTDPLPTPYPLANLITLSEQAIEFHSPTEISWAAWIFVVLLAMCCICISAFVSGSEIAYFSLTASDIEDLEEDSDNKNSQRAHHLISNSERLLATILISNNLVNVTMVVLMTFAIGQTVKFNSPVLDFIIQTVVLTFILLLCGEIFPKLVAKGRAVKWAKGASAPLTFLYNLFSPLSKLMVKSSSFVSRIVTKKAESLSTDELSQALEISDVEAGKEKEMLEGILTFGEKAVSDIMVSRVDVTDIEYHATWSEVVDTILKSGFSRIPVYDTNQDNIKGVLYSKDLLPYIGNRDDSFVWQSLLRAAYFVPESRMIDDLMEDFRRKKIHIAIVVDEYGGTQGIVTLEDILEEIVGDISDEYDEAESGLVKRLSDDTYVFDAKIPLTDFCRITGTEEEEFGDIGEAETLAGLILAAKGDFPERKESIVKGRCKFLVLDIQKHRITSVRVKVMDKIQEDTSSAD